MKRGENQTKEALATNPVASLTSHRRMTTSLMASKDKLAAMLKQYIGDDLA